jgi:uncharacterized membrane protein
MEKDLGKTTLGMQANVEAPLSYLFGFITGIIFFVLEKENKFVRFHAMQSILVSGAFFVLNVVLALIPFLGWVLLPLLGLLGLVLWIVLMVKAYMGETFKIPVIGDIAEKQV